MENETVTGLIARGDESEKVKAYMEVIEIYISIITMKAQKGIIRLNQKVATVGLKLMALAPDEVVHSFLRYQAVAGAARAGNAEDAQATIEAFAMIILSIRKDMVPETKIEMESVLDSMAIAG